MQKFFILFVFLAFLHSSQSQTVHLLLYGNKDEGDGRGCDREVDVNNMYRFFKGIASTIGYSFTYTLSSGSTFTASEAKSDIAALSVGSSDVVIFYYTGHGYNQNIDNWPTLSFNDQNYHSTKLLDALTSQAGAAKLIVFITDCCNKGFSNSFTDNSISNYSSNNYYTDNVKALFTGFSGQKTVRMTASQNGEYSWSGSCGSGKVGAYFGISFREIFKEYATERSSVSWNDIIEGSKDRTRTYKSIQDPAGKIYNRTSSSPSSGKFYVSNSIGGQQTSEYATITIGDISKRLVLEGSTLKGSVSFPLANGTYTYSISTTLTCDGYKTIKCYGTGTIYFQNGKTYSIYTNGNACDRSSVNDLYLKEVQ